MKKTAIIILALALVLCIGATSALAAGGWEGRGLYCQASNPACPAGDGSCPMPGRTAPTRTALPGALPTWTATGCATTTLPPATAARGAAITEGTGTD